MEKVDMMNLFTSFSNPKMAEIGFFPFLFILLISLLCAFFISFLYVHFSRAGATGSKIHRSFPLLALSITSIFICIQFSLPLSLGLLGALSIVRFRTPVKEPEEIGFIMLIIASSISCAIFNVLFLAIILLLAILAIFLVRIGGKVLTGKSDAGMMVMKMPTKEYQNKTPQILNAIRTLLPKGKIDGITVNDAETTLSCSFYKLPTDTYLNFQKQLQEIVKSSKINVFYHNPGEL